MNDLININFNYALVGASQDKEKYGYRVLKDLIDNARQSTNRIVATDAHISIKDKLKAHGYEWNPKARIWYLDARENTTESELEWLLKNHSIEGKVIASFGAIKRHSNRV